MRHVSAVVVVLFAVVGLVSCEAKKEETKISAPAKHGKIPHLSLKDPNGVPHSSETLLKNGLVLVATAPTLGQESNQKGWSEYLLETMPKKGKARLVFTEDMTASSFKGTALKEMKKEYDPNEPLLLLIDDTGSIRERLGVEKGKTEVLVYNSQGNLLHCEKGKPSKASAAKMWGMLK